MWLLSITDNNGFYNYNTVEIEDIIDMGDSYNIMLTNNNELFLDKQHCSVTDKKIYYNNKNLEVLLEVV